MGRLKELQRQRGLLVKDKEKRSKILKEQIETRKLKQEIRELKHPKTFAAIRTIRAGAGTGLRAAGVGTRNAITKQFNIGVAERERQLANRRCKVKKSVRREVLSELKKKKSKTKRRKRK